MSHKCNSSSTFRSIIRGALGSVHVPQDKAPLGFGGTTRKDGAPLSQHLPDPFDQADVEKLFSQLNLPTLLLIDEFDRASADERAKMSDLIKIVADETNCPLTIMIVGVAETLDDLIKAHPSVERNISEVHMGLMESTEICELLAKGSAKVGIPFSAEAVESITYCAAGFPYFAHLIAQHCSIVAIESSADLIGRTIFEQALKRSLAEVEQTIKRAYREAVQANRPTLFPEVLLASALAAADDFGFFHC